jgi:hypothetical protein
VSEERNDKIKEKDIHTYMGNDEALAPNPKKAATTADKLKESI